MPGPQPFDLLACLRRVRTRIDHHYQPRGLGGTRRVFHLIKRDRTGVEHHSLIGEPAHRVVGNPRVGVAILPANHPPHVRAAGCKGFRGGLCTLRIAPGNDDRAAKTLDQPLTLPEPRDLARDALGHVGLTADQKNDGRRVRTRSACVCRQREAEASRLQSESGRNRGGSRNLAGCGLVRKNNLRRDEVDLIVAIAILQRQAGLEHGGDPPDHQRLCISLRCAAGESRRGGIGDNRRACNEQQEQERRESGPQGSPAATRLAPDLRPHFP